MGNLFLNYLLEFMMLLPAAVMAFLPCAKHLRFRPAIVYVVAFSYVTVVVLVGAFAASLLDIPTNCILIPCLFLAFVPLLAVSTLNHWKTAYCFFNAVLLCSFSSTYALYATAPWENGNTTGVLAVQSGAVYLGIACLVLAVAARTLIVKLPALFENSALDISLWKWALFAVIAMTAFVIWMTPVSAANAMVGYVRVKGMAVMILVALFAWLLHHIAWQTASRTAQWAQMEHEIQILKLERRRNDELLSYIDDARAARHDFRHHMAVIDTLLDAGKVDEAHAYAKRFVESSSERPASLYCTNGAIDAIAAHYDFVAEESGVDTTWLLDTQIEPSAAEESDLCSTLGNLVENAIIAAAKCPEGKRWMKAKMVARPASVVTIVVQNSFAEPVELGSDGIPRTDRPGHGIGSSSVAAIAHKYDGRFDVYVEDNVFTAIALLYPQEGAQT